MRRASISVVFGLTLVAFFPRPAEAAVQLGQTGNPAQTCAQDRAHVQQGIAAGNGYRAGGYGVITSWRTGTSSPAGHSLQLLILRANPTPGGVGHFYTVIRKDSVRVLAGANSFQTRIPIEAGEELGLYVPAGQPLVMGLPAGYCMFATGFGADQWRSRNGDPPIGTSIDYTNSGTGARLNVSATVEPDADRDGFGDETQDRCPQFAATELFCRCTIGRTTLAGSARDNVITGTRGRDVIAALPGTDIVRGGKGKDVICGGDGNDKLIGGPGRDFLFGDNGRDKLRGGKGNDSLFGGFGKDKLNGGPGKKDTQDQ
jgi:hypothetical protein